MFTTTGRVFTGLTRAVFGQGTIIHKATATGRWNSVRPLTLSCRRLAGPNKPREDDQEVNNEPIKFSTSKASHKSWRVDRSLGSQFERPWWRVLPISVFAVGFLLWCALREETDVDVQLEKKLYEHLPGLVSDEEEEEGEQVQNKSSS